MTDRILNSAWWLAIMLMICATAAVTLCIGYHGLLELLGGRWMPGTLAVGIAAGAAIAAFQLCQHRHDLV